MKRFSSYFLISCLALISACNGVGTAEFNEAAVGTGGNSAPPPSQENGVDSTIIFAGVTSVTGKDDRSLTLNWAPHADAVAYDIFDSTSGTLVYKSTVVGQGQSSVALSGLTPAATYTFRVRLKNSSGLYDSNTNDYSVTMNAAPNIPSALSLITPATTPGYITTPTIRVDGVKAGDTIRLFSNSDCSTEIGLEVAAGDSVDITASALAAGPYTFYANSTNDQNNTSSCSTATVTYQLNGCPVGYSWVPPNSTLGVNSLFCVAQFEMKNVGGVATSQAALAPWVSITQSAAKTACTSLGAGFDLISNPEWMTIAHEIEKGATNWTSGVVGTGTLFRGHSGNNPSSLIAVSDTTDPFSNIVSPELERRRTFTLSNGQVIWDFAGNAWEWVDWSLGGGLTLGPINCNNSWMQLPAVSCAGLAAADYMPDNPAGNNPTLYDSRHALGQVYGGTDGTAIRGGYFAYANNGGVFALVLGNNSGLTFATNTGFRCVFRP
jgi:hypothetical protein